LNKVDVNTGNSLSDNDNFLMAFTVLATICQESMLDIHDDIIRPFAGLFPAYIKQGVFFKNLYAQNGALISGFYDLKNGWIKIDNPVSQKIMVEIPHKWTKFILKDSKNRIIEYELSTINSRFNCKDSKSRIITFFGQENSFYFVERL
jgi:hypothetical protein